MNNNADNTIQNGPLAQLVEHLTLNQGVQGSSPWRSTKKHCFWKLVLPGMVLFCCCVPPKISVSWRYGDERRRRQKAMYLDWFTFPDGEQEVDFFYGIQRTCYDSYYPFQVLSKRKFCRIDFER